MTYLLSLDMLSTSTSQKDAFYSSMAVLASASKVPLSKEFISKALTQTSFVFLALDRDMEISSKLDALKR